MTILEAVAFGAMLAWTRATARCSALASSDGARIQTSRSSSVSRMTGMALGWIGYNGIRRRP
jgi:hypothetical protein